MVQTPGQYAAVVAAVRDEAAELLEGLELTAAEEEEAAEKEEAPSCSLPPAPVAVVPPGGLLSDEGSGEDD